MSSRPAGWVPKVWVVMGMGRPREMVVPAGTLNKKKLDVDYASGCQSGHRGCSWICHRLLRAQASPL